MRERACEARDLQQAIGHCDIGDQAMAAPGPEFLPQGWCLPLNVHLCIAIARKHCEVARDLLTTRYGPEPPHRRLRGQKAQDHVA